MAREHNTELRNFCWLLSQASLALLSRAVHDGCFIRCSDFPKITQGRGKRLWRQAGLGLNSKCTTFYITSNWFHNLSELLFPHLQNGASTWNMHSYLEDWRKSRACQALYNWEFFCLLVLSKSGVEFSSIEWNEGSRSHCRMFQAMDRCFSLSLPTRGNTAQRSK